LVAQTIWAAKWLVWRGAFGQLLRQHVTLTQNDNSYVFDWTNKQTNRRPVVSRLVFGSTVWSFGSWRPNSSKHKSQTAVEVKTQSSGLKNWLRAQLFKCEL